MNKFIESYIRPLKIKLYTYEKKPFIAGFVCNDDIQFI